MNTIKIKRYLDIVEERPCGSTAITPGMLVELEAGGTVKPHASADADVEKAFALEDELQGRGIATNYTEGDPVQIWFANAGEVVYGIMDSGVTPAVGSFVQSNGDGKLKAAADGTTIGVVLEAKDATTHRVKIRVV